MTNIVDIPVTGLPLIGHEEGGSEENKWASIFGFRGNFSQEIIDTIFDMHMGYLTPHAKNSYLSGFVFRVHGGMDIATFEAAERARPLVKEVIPNPLVQAVLIPHDDAEKAIAEQQPIRGYTVTRTVAAILGIVLK